MHRTSVSSSNLASIGYDGSQNTLEVEFLDGSVYQYYGVPSHLYEGLMSASSNGTFLSQYIKKGGYEYKKIK